ncbi:hypothetical protein [Lacrimispora sp.]|uniref:hypothetical protein n=1 Tax=Lacrimispora sp. TaxID=2719234 RepID=UPI00345F9C9C
MNIEKKVMGNLTKCYSIAPLRYKERDHILVAAEKVDRCLLFDTDGNLEDTIWTEPGGVMTMVQVPGTDGQFLATHKFYSPNDSKEARIVIVTPMEEGGWEVRTLADLPFVHRFNIIERNGVNYLIACTLKSGHEFKDDWSTPGKVYAAVLPEDLSGFNQDNQLKLEVIKDNMLKNHGYYKVEEQGIQTSLISCDSGVYQFIPPAAPSEPWEIHHLIKEAASDGVLVDFDGDGEKELAVISPFHGDKISIWKKSEGEYKEVYVYDQPAEFNHAVYGGMLCGKPALVIGHRQGERNLFVLRFNPSTKTYETEMIDRNCGPANVYKYTKNESEVIISTNHGIDEIAMYTLKA